MFGVCSMTHQDEKDKGVYYTEESTYGTEPIGALTVEMVDNMTKEQLEVALSTQLFDNRVVIDGNVGVMGKQQSSNTSNIVGDVNVEVKITPDGRFRVKAFNRSNVTTSINTLDEKAPYTQGVGVFYRKEFDTFGDLFKRKKNYAKIR